MPWAAASTGATSASRSVRSTCWPIGGTRRRPDPESAGTERTSSVGASISSTCCGATDDELLATHGRWYIADRDPRYLRRNALVALGNVGDGADPATEAVLAPLAVADDAMLAEHARWAATELGRADLIGRGPMTHLLVTNDFPPKVGGIQAYLWELWRRLDPDTFAVLTARSHPDAAAFDREQAARGIRIERVPLPGAAPRRPAWSAASGTRPDGSAPTWSSSIRCSRWA